MIVGSDTIAARISEVYQSYYTALQNDLINLSSQICLTADIWTSPNSLALMGVTAHWISEDGKLLDIIIDVIDLEDISHTGKSLATALLKTVSDMGIAEKIFSITVDNASNMQTMGRQLALTLPNFNPEANMIPCVNHIFNLAVQDGLKACGALPTDLEDDEESNEDVDISEQDPKHREIRSRISSKKKRNSATCAPQGIRRTR